MMKTLSFSTIMMAVAILTGTNADDWASFRGPNANGISPEKGINKNWKKRPPKILWSMPMSDNGHAIPAIYDGKAYLLDHEGDEDIVKCLDLRTGKELWRHAYKDATKQKWGFTRVGLVCDKGKLFTLSRMGKLFCFDAATGKIVWGLDYVNDFGGKTPMWGFSGTPVVDGNHLIISPLAPKCKVAALDLNTGKVIWKCDGDVNPGHSTPVVGKLNGVKQFVFATKYGLAGIAEGGEVLWTAPFKTKHGNNIATPILLDGNHVFITANYKHGCGVFKVTGDKAEKVWENDLLRAHFNAPVLVDGLIYGIGDPGALLCLDPKTGAERWSKRGFGKGGLIVVDGVIIAVDGSTGEVVMVKLDPDKYVEMGRVTPLEKDKISWTPPILADKKLIVRNRTGVACLDLSP